MFSQPKRGATPPFLAMRATGSTKKEISTQADKGVAVEGKSGRCNTRCNTKCNTLNPDKQRDFHKGVAVLHYILIKKKKVICNM